MADLSLIFNLLARDNASGTLNNVGNSAEGAGKKIGGAVKAAAGFLVGGAFAAGLKSLYDAAEESARIAARTENVIAQMGNAAGVSAQQVGDLAGAIAAKTGVDDEAIQAGQNLLLTFGNIRDEAGAGNDIFSQTSQIMVDMSAAMGTDASSSAVQLGKALNDPIKGITALSKAGVSFTEEQKEQIRTLTESGDVLGAQKIILGELEKQFGGAAEAMSTPLDRAKVAVGNLAEEMGGYLLPVVGEAADALTDRLGGAGDKLGPSMASVADSLGEMIPTLLDLAETGAELGADILPLVTGSLGLLVDIAGALGPALPAVVAGFAGMKVAGVVAGPIGSLGGKMTQLGTAADGSVNKLGKVGGAISGLGKALPIVGLAVSVFTTVMAQQEKDIQRSTDRIKGLYDAMREGGAAGIQAGTDMQLYSQLASEGVLNLDTAMDRAETSNRDYWESLNPLQQATQKQTEWTNNLSYAIDTYGEHSEEARTAQERYAYWTGVVEQRQGALDGAIEAATATTGTYEERLEAAKVAAQEVSTATDDFKFALDQLTGAHVSQLEVEARFQDALRAAQTALEGKTGAVLDNNGALALQTEAGNTAFDTLNTMRGGIYDVIAAMQANNATSDEVVARQDQLRDNFYQTALQMTGSEEAAERLTMEILGIPDNSNTVITADTGPAQQTISDFMYRITNSGGVVTVSPELAQAWRTGMATGGEVPGWSPHKRADNVPIMATAGEYMQNVDAVDYYGVGFMEALNRRQIPRDQLQYLAAGGSVLGEARFPFNANPDRLFQVKYPDRVGTGAVGGAWESLWKLVKGQIPQARINSTFRPGDPGYHGRGKAIDFGFGSGPGGAGSAGLASINRLLHDQVGGNLAELIYDGIGDDRPDLKNGRRLTYSAATRNQHRNHVHAAVYDDGGLLRPGYTLAYNGTGQSETIRTAGQEAALADSRGAVFHLYDSDGALMGSMRGVAETVTAGAMGGQSARKRYNR